MNAISVVIITRNEENNIVDCIRSARLVSKDVVVVDCGSDDDTVPLAQAEGARTFVVPWQGFGNSRNFGASQAAHDWILSLDADERITPALAAAILHTQLEAPNIVLRFRRENFLAGKPVQYGTLGFEQVKRVYNRQFCAWDLTLVHEKLVYSVPAVVRTIGGSLSHFGLSSLQDYRERSIRYAELSASKYLAEGRQAGLFKRLLSPLFNSFKSYFLLLGFLEGSRGWQMAGIIAMYSRMKYECLHQLLSEQKKGTSGYKLQALRAKV